MARSGSSSRPRVDGEAGFVVEAGAVVEAGRGLRGRAWAARPGVDGEAGVVVEAVAWAARPGVDCEAGVIEAGRRSSSPGAWAGHGAGFQVLLLPPLEVEPPSLEPPLLVPIELPEPIEPPDPPEPEDEPVPESVAGIGSPHRPSVRQLPSQQLVSSEHHSATAPRGTHASRQVKTLGSGSGSPTA